MKDMVIVYAYVCADPLHEAHVLAMENAKGMGDKLIVGVLTDDAIMEKKPVPALPFTERLRAVKGLRCVDAVVKESDKVCQRALGLNGEFIPEGTNVILDNMDEVKRNFRRYFVWGHISKFDQKLTFILTDVLLHVNEAQEKLNCRLKLLKDFIDKPLQRETHSLNFDNGKFELVSRVSG